VVAALAPPTWGLAGPVVLSDGSISPSYLGDWLVLSVLSSGSTRALLPGGGRLAGPVVLSGGSISPSYLGAAWSWFC
jgi:hypothetical protein